MQFEKFLGFMRHAESHANVATAAAKNGDHSHFTREYLSRHDREHELTQRGMEQVMEAGRWLSGQPWFQVDLIVCSMHVRAIQTARLLALPSHIPILFDRQLGEQDWGVTYNSCHPNDWDAVGYTQYAQAYYSNPHLCPPCGESVAMHYIRTLELVARLVELQRQYPRILCVSHGGSIRLIRMVMDGAGIHEFERYRRYCLRNCDMLAFAERNGQVFEGCFSPRAGDAPLAHDWRPFQVASLVR